MHHPRLSQQTDEFGKISLHAGFGLPEGYPCPFGQLLTVDPMLFDSLRRRVAGFINVSRPAA
jgi:hypothetical protein